MASSSKAILKIPPQMAINATKYITNWANFSRLISSCVLTLPGWLITIGRISALLSGAEYIALESVARDNNPWVETLCGAFLVGAAIIIKTRFLTIDLMFIPANQEK